MDRGEKKIRREEKGQSALSWEHFVYVLRKFTVNAKGVAFFLSYSLFASAGEGSNDSTKEGDGADVEDY